MENKTALTLIAYWQSFYEPQYPDPGSFVEEAWDPKQKEQIVAYLKAAQQMPYAFGGNSWCRFRCGISSLGNTEYTDGKYLWPEGLVHYVEAHNVKLPREVIEHMLENKMVAVGDEYTVDGSWWLQQKGENTTVKTFNDRLDIGILTLVQVHDKRKHKQEEALRFYLMDAFGVKGRLAAVDAVLSGQETSVKGRFNNVSAFIAKLPALGLQGSFQYLTKEEYGLE
jgi:hypothetical protein